MLAPRGSAGCYTLATLGGHALGARVEPRARRRYAESPSRRRGRAVSSVGTSARFTRERSLVQVQYRPPSRRTIKEAAAAERAEVAEPADALRSGRSGVYPRASSNLAFGTRLGLALVAQGIERCPAEAEVVGSNPTGRARLLNLRRLLSPNEGGQGAFSIGAIFGPSAPTSPAPTPSNCAPSWAAPAPRSGASSPSCASGCPSCPSRTRSPTPSRRGFGSSTRCAG